MIDFELPDELIAQEPVSPRDHARMLVYNRVTRTITDDYFYNLLKYLPELTTVVVNNSKVDRCRYLFNGGKREIFALESVNNKTVRALVRPGKVFKLGKKVQLTEAITAEVTSVDEDGIRTIVFSEPLDHPDLISAQHVPLPPYIVQNDKLAEEYQTIYAKTNGSKAAPTAGLHFTDELKKKAQSERDWAELTLHVGLGTFAPLTSGQLSAGRLHEEWYEIDLIQPGYEFQRVNSLITNFHLPGTSLLLLVEAFVGSTAEMQRIYDHAIAEKYRFYSFGDCMLIL